MAINLPIFKDRNTPYPFREPLPKYLQQLLAEQNKDRLNGLKINNSQPTPPEIPRTLPDYTPDALEECIYMDAMAFGMGSSCLQVTFQACSVEQARRLYDQLTPVTPLMLALSASSPIYRGFLADVDARWDVIVGSVDDRTPEERGQVV